MEPEVKFLHSSISETAAASDMAIGLILQYCWQIIRIFSFEEKHQKIRTHDKQACESSAWFTEEVIMCVCQCSGAVAIHHFWKEGQIDPEGS